MGAGSGSAEFLGKSSVKPSPKAPLSSRPGHLLRQLPQVPKEAPRARRRTGMEVTRRCSVEDLGMGFAAGAARPRQGLPRQLDPGSTEALRSTARDRITWPRPLVDEPLAPAADWKSTPGSQGSRAAQALEAEAGFGLVQNKAGGACSVRPHLAKGEGLPAGSRAGRCPRHLRHIRNHEQPVPALPSLPAPGQGRDFPAVCRAPRDQGCPTLTRQHGMLQLCIPVQRGGGGEWPPPGQGARGCSRDLMDEPEV